MVLCGRTRSRTLRKRSYMRFILTLCQTCGSYTHKDAFVAAFMYTVLVTADGPVLLTQPSIWYSEDKLKTEKSLADEDLKKLLEKTITVSDVTGTGAKRKRNTKKKTTGAKEGAVEGEAK